MIIPTRLMDVGDLELTGWKVFEVARIDGMTGMERHIFGFCLHTDKFQISSEILEETPEWIRTRSRRYFKIGAESRGWGIEELMMFTEFLELWGIGDSEIDAVVESLR